MRYPGSKLPSLFFKTLGKIEKELYLKTQKRSIDQLIIENTSIPHKKKTLFLENFALKSLATELNQIQVRLNNNHLTLAS